LYDSFAEFYSSNDVVDKITTNGSNVNVTHTFEVAGALKFDDADEISNLTNSGTSTTALVTAKSVTGASTVELDETEAALFDTIDISAGTTGSSKIDLSASSAAHTIVGSKTARNTLSGGEGADIITGGSGRDTVDGGLLADTVTLGGGADTYIFAAGDSVAADDLLHTGPAEAADTDEIVAASAGIISFDNGVDIINGFSSDDFIKGIGTAIDTTVSATTTWGDIVDAKVLVMYGTNGSDNNFVIAGAFDLSTAHDAVVMLTDADNKEGATNTNSIILTNLAAALADTNFIA
jgi:hypothetical protein